MMNSRECTDYFRDKELNELDEGFIAEFQYCARVPWSEEICEVVIVFFHSNWINQRLYLIIFYFFAEWKSPCFKSDNQK